LPNAFFLTGICSIKVPFHFTLTEEFEYQYSITQKTERLTPATAKGNKAFE
jgi:hypothetical protein